ncbi:MAG: heat-shock protein Hsp90 [Synergistaceae bacterium]|nr:heat-shock protein Hsp90 [Synergistaceae bacterium]
MTKQEILAKVNELIAAPMCNPELKAAAEAYLKAQDKKSADALVKMLEATVSSVDETIAFAESEAGAKVFGAEAAKGLAAAAKKAKAEGGKYCICPACQAGGAIWESREALA